MKLNSFVCQATDSYPFSSREVELWEAVHPEGNLKNEVELECESDR